MSRTGERHLPEMAFAWADALPVSADTEALLLVNASGRILGRDIFAETAIPAQRTAATDGFALRASDTTGSGDYNPQAFRLRPGASRLGQYEAVPVLTGDPMPEGGDTVLPVEYGDLHQGTLAVVQPQVAGDHVAEIGEESRAGDVLLPAGRFLRPQDLAMLALAGWDHLPVWRKPVVSVLLAGAYGRDADGPMLASLVARDGGCVADVRPVSDGPSLVKALTQSTADLILVAGATGEAATDHAADSLAQAGSLDIRRVAIHPGGSVALGRAGGIPVVLLPGTPLACFAAYDLIGARVLRRLARLPGSLPYRSLRLPLESKLTSSIGRLELCRVRIDDGLVRPLAIADGRKLATVVKADGFVIVPGMSEGYGRGTEVLVHLYD